MLEFRLPLHTGEQPTGSLVTSEAMDDVGLAARGSTLYVAATEAQTLSAYSLPLQQNEKPLYTIATPHQIAVLPA